MQMHVTFPAYNYRSGGYGFRSVAFLVRTQIKMIEHAHIRYIVKHTGIFTRHSCFIPYLETEMLIAPSACGFARNRLAQGDFIYTPVMNQNYLSPAGSTQSQDSSPGQSL